MLTLTRFAHLPSAELGILRWEGSAVWSLERPWLDNRLEVSCIPVGRYQVRRWSSARFPISLEVLGTAPRTYILIHPANRPEQLKGCIALGLDLNGMPYSPSIGRSKLAVQTVFDLVGSSTVDLIIENGGLEIT